MELFLLQIKMDDKLNRLVEERFAENGLATVKWLCYNAHVTSMEARRLVSLSVSPIIFDFEQRSIRIYLAER